MRSYSISGSVRERQLRSSLDDRSSPIWIDIEAALRRAGFGRIVGVDEAGRGPLAGPVVAAAIVLAKDVPRGIADSKKLNYEQRLILAQALSASAVDIGIGIVSPSTIDCINILQATRLAMRQAIQSLRVTFDCVLVDGDSLPEVQTPVIGVIKGDAICQSIAAASIIAKVVRDRLMESMDQVYPRYNFKSNKGYGTREHIEALRRYGPSRIHRYSFEPVCRILEGRT